MKIPGVPGDASQVHRVSPVPSRDLPLILPFPFSPCPSSFVPRGDTGNSHRNRNARPASSSRRVNRITWDVIVPTAFGLDPETFSATPQDLDADLGERAYTVRQGCRRLAVVPFDGLPQVCGMLGIIASFATVLVEWSLSSGQVLYTGAGETTRASADVAASQA